MCGWRKIEDHMRTCVNRVKHSFVFLTPALFSTSRLEGILIDIINRRVASLSPEEALRFLLSLDATLYAIQSKQSVAYGKGLHTKHWHTHYHDFFSERIHSNERVIDIGCGNGALDYTIAEKTGASILGIDLNARSICTAREKFTHPKVSYIIGDVLQALPERKYDVAILSNVLEHLPNRSNFLRRVQETVDAKRFLIRVPVFERDWRVPLKKELGIDWRLDPTHEPEYTLESFEQEMTEASLQIDHLEVRWGEIWAETHPLPK